MEIKDLNLSIKAINKFFYYSMNYPTIRIEYPSIDGTWKYDYLPDFFKVLPINMVEHFRGKWIEAVGKTDSYGFVNKFYAELDSNYRADILRYIMENYDDECKIHTFGE